MTALVAMLAVPLGQSSQRVARSAGWYWPAGQRVQCGAETFEYEPREQGEHCGMPETGACRPGSHAVHAAEPDVEKLPGEHAMHEAAEDAPLILLWLPALQLVQTPPLA